MRNERFSIYRVQSFQLRLFERRGREIVDRKESDLTTPNSEQSRTQSRCCTSKGQKFRDASSRMRTNLVSLTKPGLRRDMLSWSTIVIIGTSAIISLLYVFIFVAKPKYSYDIASHNFISNNPILKDGEPIDGLQRWLDDFSSSVVPIMCHSHNDYWRPYQLFSALAAGCAGVEADVWLQDDGETLLVGHDRDSLNPQRTLEKMYLDPLFEILEKRNRPEVWANNTVYDRARGVFQTQPNTTLVLLVDVKTDQWPAGKPTVYPKPGFIERQHLWPSALTVTGSGNMERLTIHHCYPELNHLGHSTYYDYHDTFVDAPLGQLPDNNKFWRHELGTGASIMWSNDDTYYASVSFQQSIGSARTGFSDKQLEKLRKQIWTAQKSGLKAGY
ncbi:hypothetical protein K469DRAFT_743745 [Zopfia rhizophila CBS 207.26]|uniref:Altered inheritance of mitochondria protein 6 n=1 Tax=Zopfia rhizophila CBS 207.26 TaxID=1314779 RepID=A0A6A6EWD6_9PEZI|nr:hypothetical protein K469DRAFT_743745 [Zopfia rhizophila CBS 207.26]